MKLIGMKRVLILAILLAINVAIAAVYFFQIDPMRVAAEQHLAEVNDQISSQSQKIANIKAELETYKKNLPQFQQLEAKGFTLNQDRFQMSRDLDRVRVASDLAGFSFVINDIKKIENPDADAAKMQLIDSRIKVENVVSLLDINFYDFMDMMQSEFPAHLRIQSFQVSRKDPLDATALIKIARKQPVTLLTATASFDWLTMVPKVAEQKPGQGGGL